MAESKASIERKDLDAVGYSEMVQDFGTDTSLYQLTQDDGIYYLNGADGAAVPGEAFIFLNEKKNGYEVLNSSKIVDRYLALYAGDKEKLRKNLYLARKITKSAYTTKDDTSLIKGVLSAAREYTVNQVLGVKFGGLRNFQSFNTFLNEIKEPETDTNVDVNLSSKDQSDRNFNQFMMEYFGRPASPAEQRAYYQKLNAAERKAVTRTTTTEDGTVSVGGGLNEADRLQIMAETVKPILKGTTAEELATKGGKLAQDIADLKEYAAEYGIRITGGDALKRLTSGIGKRGILGDVDAEKNRLKEESKAYYSNLADKIDAGVSVGSIAKQFAYIKGQLLETPDNAIDVFDQDVQAALRNDGKQGLMSFTDFRRAIKQNPLWSKTQNAREEAANYADTILRSFGLI